MTDYEVMLERDEDGVVVASVPALDGCYTQGKNVYEAMDRIHEAIEACTGEKPGFVCQHKFMRFNPLELDEYYIRSNIDMKYERVGRAEAIKLFEAWKLLYRFNSVYHTTDVSLGYGYDTVDLAGRHEYYIGEMYRFAAKPRSDREEIKIKYEMGTKLTKEELVA